MAVQVLAHHHEVTTNLAFGYKELCLMKTMLLSESISSLIKWKLKLNNNKNK